MDPVERYARAVVAHRRLLLVAVLIATTGFGVGVTATDWELGVAEFDVDSEATEAQAYVDDAFETDERPITLLVVRGDHAVTREGVLESMDAQEAIRTNETVAPTLADDASTVGIGNGLAVAVDPRLRMFGGSPSIDAKRSVLEGRTDDQFERDLERLLASDDVAPDGYPPASSLLPRGYRPGEYRPGESDAAHLVVVVHGPDASDEELLAAQRTVEAIGDDRIRSADSFVIGQQLAFDRASQATADGFALVGPLLFVTVVVALALAYRDPVDVLVTLGGLGVVLVWLAGFLGWTGIGINQLLVAVPCLVVGLGIDYSLHVVMRTREAAERFGGDGIDGGALDGGALDGCALETAASDAERAATDGLSGVAFAIGATTATTALGFLAGVASPIAPLREFAVASAFGILATFVVFGAALPALRVERRRRLAGRDSMTTPSPIGRVRSVERAVGVGRLAAVAMPVLVVMLAVGLAVGGAYGATTIDTSTDRSEFLPSEQPAWVASLPEPVRPAEYGLREQAVYVDETFDRPTDRRASVLVRGDVTDPAALAAVERAHREEIDPAITATPIGGDDPIRTPLSAVERIAAEDDAVAEAYADADTTGDGVPDRNVDRLFDAAFEADPAAMAAVVERDDDGSYRSVRTVVTVNEGVDDAVVTRELDAVAASLSAEGVDSTATGEPVLAHQRATAILTTAVETFVLAFVAIGALLTAAFRLRYGTWTLGLLTVTPVVLALAWLLGTMSLLSIPYNAETAIITGIALGLGTDYAIHVSDRFQKCRADGDPTTTALDGTLQTTAGTLVASAVTTAVAFALLGLTFVPPLQRFGLITALAVAYSLFAAVVVLPSLLVLRERIVQPT